MNPDSADLPEVSSNTFCIEPALKPAGRLKFFLPEWRELTSDSQILKTVQGFNVEFVDRPPTQVLPAKEIPFNPEETRIVDSELEKLGKKGVIVNSKHSQGDFISTIFLRKRKTGGYEVILNLENLNQYISNHHFKMTPGCYMASIDLQDAHYYVPVDENYQNI